MVPFLYIIFCIWVGMFLVLVALSACLKKKRIIDPESSAAFADHPHQE